MGQVGESSVGNASDRRIVTTWRVCAPAARRQTLNACLIPEPTNDLHLNPALIDYKYHSALMT